MTTTHNNNNTDLTTTSNFTFPQFDIVSQIPDHHFLSRKPSLNPQESCFKVLSKEFRILQENLPDSIFVRVSENRYDLLRAAIIGAAGTPYHDGIFIFDISIPANYPTKPPKVYYHSHGYRINPNLYQSGRVCLSLLNTWFGNKKKNEKWNSKQSTILQILVSLQSLVLNEKPYYNVGFHTSNEVYTAKDSEYYSQDIFVISCWSYIHLIRNPPASFEPLLVHHFRKKGNAILSACEAYTNGRVKIGFYGCNVLEMLPSGFKIRRSFQEKMEVVYRRLVEEFRRINVDVTVVRKPLVVIENPPVVQKKRQGIVRRIMIKMKKFFS